MNVAIEISSNVHHLRSIRASRCPRSRLANSRIRPPGARTSRGCGGRSSSPGSAPAWPTPSRKRTSISAPGASSADRLAVDGDVDRVAAGLVADPQDVVGGDDQRPRGQRVRRDVADHIALHPPGQDRAAVGEVVAGRPRRRRGDQPVAADVPDLLAGDRVAELGEPGVRAAGVKVTSLSARGAARRRPRGPGSSIASKEPREGRLEPSRDLVALDRGEEADRAEVDPEDRHAASGRSAAGPRGSSRRRRGRGRGRGARAARQRPSRPSAAAPCFSASSAVATSSTPASRAAAIAAATTAAR